MSIQHLFDKCTSKKLPEGQVLTDPMLTIFSTPSSITLTMYSCEAFNSIFFAFPDVTFTKLLYSFVNGGWIANAEKSNILTPRFIKLVAFQMMRTLFEFNIFTLKSELTSFAFGYLLTKLRERWYVKHVTMQLVCSDTFVYNLNPTFISKKLCSIA